MNRSRIVIAIVSVVATIGVRVEPVAAQRIFSNAIPAESQYSGATSLDSIGRSANAEGRAVDPYGLYIGDAGASGAYRPSNGTAYGMYSYAPGAYYPAGYYYPGGYSGLGYTNGIGYSVGLGGYSGGYAVSTGRFGTGVGFGASYIAPPRTVVINGVYPSRTVMNNATRGGVVEYTHKGNGYIYSPGTSSQTVISNGPSIFPTVSVVQPTQPPVVINTQPLQTTSKTFGRGATATAPGRPFDETTEIRLICPKESTGPLSYSLNGTIYSIKPGYSQTFPDDRPWTMEFLRGGNGSPPMRYELQAGTYRFSTDENGWDLKRSPSAATVDYPTLPPPPPAAAPIPSPDL